MTELLAYTSIPDGDTVTLLNSNGDGISSTDLSDLLHWLAYSSTGGRIRVVHDIDQFLAPVLRKMPVPLLKLLIANDDAASYDGNTMFYAPHKVFRIRKAYYYGIQEFFPSNTPDPSSVMELQGRADRLTEALSLLGMGDFRRIASPIAIFEQTELGRRTYEQIPRDYEIPSFVSGMLEYADMADRKEWISNYQIGHWDALFDWDISACYSEQASKLIHLHDLEYWRSNTITSREEGAIFGFCRGRMWIDPDHPMQHCSPIMVKDIDGTGKQGNPAGWLPEDCYSLSEIRFIQNSGLGEFLMSDGFFARVQNGVKPRYPFKDIMEYLYQHRGWSEMCASVTKNIANQLVGKLIERLRWRGNREGELYNSVYHSLITTGGRVKVARWLLDNDVQKQELVCAQTDGCRVTKAIPPPATNGMGKWRCNGAFPTLVASPNIVLAQDRKPQHYTYDMIVDEIKARPGQSYYGMLADHRMTLAQAVEWGDISRVGEVITLPAHLDLFAIPRQQNRHFDRLPKTGKQLLRSTYQSTPVVLG
jgi:hypothetical protein